MAHAVEDREVQDALVERVVEGVAADVVAGLQHRAEHEVIGGQDERWDQLPQQLAGHRHRLLSARELEEVAVHALGRDQDRAEVGIALADRQGRLRQRLLAVQERDLHRAEPLRAVQQR
jgi:hypothetical protein